MKQSFSSICPCCQTKLTTYQKKLRSNVLPALRLLCEAHRPMTAVELSSYFPEPQKTEIRRHFPSLRLWRLIEKDGQKCRPTAHGFHFVAGDSTVPLYVFTRNNRLTEKPEEAQEPPSVNFSDLCPPPSTPKDETPATEAIQETLAIL